MNKSRFVPSKSGVDMHVLTCLQPFSLLETLGINPNHRHLITLVGGGGKTTLLFKLAKELKTLGKKVLVTTTTAMYEPMEDQYDRLILEDVPVSDDKCSKPNDCGFIEMLGSTVKNGKLLGISKEAIDRIKGKGQYDMILVEGDGAKCKPIKMPGDHEPVIPEMTEIVIGVMGLDAIGNPIDSEYVHRPELFYEKLTLESDLVTPEVFRAMISHEEGLFKNTPKKSQKIVVLNKADDSYLRDLGQQIVEMVREDYV